MISSEKEDTAKLVREYVEAVEAHKKLVDEYVTVGIVQPGQKLKRPKKVLTLSALDALDKAKEREDKAHRRWHEAIAGQ